MILLLAEIVAVGCIILALYSLKPYLGLSLLFVFVGANQFLQNVLAATVYVEILERYPVSPGSAVLFSSSLLAILLVYVREGVPTARRLIYSILLANLSLALIVVTTRAGLESGVLKSAGFAVDWFSFYTIGAFVLGTTLLVLDVFLVIVLYEVLAARVRWVGLWGHIVLALCAVLAIDSLVFGIVVFRGLPEAGDLLVGNMGGKVLSGLLNGSLLWLYLSFSGDRNEPTTREIMDPLSIFTYREQRKLAEQRLEQTERHYRELFEDAPLMYVTTGDVEGLPFVKDCNGAFIETLGYEREEVIGRPLSDFYSEESERELLGEHGYRVALTGQPVIRERELVTKRGEVIFTLLRAHSERNPDGAIVETRAMYVDISERKRAEEALSESERRLADAQRIARIGNWRLNFATSELQWSDELFRILGLAPDTSAPLTEESFLERVHPADRQRRKQLEEAAAPEARPFALDHRIIKPDGKVRVVHAEVRWETDAGGRPVGSFGTIQDITEQQEAEEALKRSKEQLRNLAAGLEAARESERATIAREVHDELGQALTGLKMDLSTLSPASLSEVDNERVEGMMLLIDRTIETVRDLSSRLRPPILDDLGLCEAIEWQVAEFTQRSGLDCRLDLEAECEELDETLALSVFRIVQEALTNVARHAEASKVEITLDSEDSALFLCVQDNGKGIDPAVLEAGDSLGLLGMRERAIGLGGMLTVGPAGGKGTRVSLSVPL